MPRIVKRELGSSSRADMGGPRIVKREQGSRGRGENGEAETSDSASQGVVERRVLRSHYLAMKNLINEERDDISRVDSDKFRMIINQVENLHQLVQKPREQVADAEALLDIASTLVTSVKSHGNEGTTAADFVTSLLNFGQHGGLSANTEDARNSVAWGEVGIAVSDVFRRVNGCCTMLGPMDTEVKQRRVAAQRKRVRPTESARPEELHDAGAEERTDTDINMATMFDILRKKKKVGLENLVLNRKSFAQTVENIFALSFLVKDGRASITVDESGRHLVSPKNAPNANAVASGEVSYSHFVFRFDFRDWKLMITSVGIGEELMPHRNRTNTPSESHLDQAVGDTHAATAPTTPIRKLSRNRGLVIQEQSVVEESPESNDAEPAAIRKGKRKLG